MEKLKQLFVVMLIVLCSSFAYAAAPTVTQSLTAVGTLGNMYKLTLDITIGSDGADSNVADTAVSAAIAAKIKGWYLYQVTTNTTDINEETDFYLTTETNTSTNLLGTTCDDMGATAVKKSLVSEIYSIDETLHFKTVGNDETGSLIVTIIFVR